MPSPISPAQVDVNNDGTVDWEELSSFMIEMGMKGWANSGLRTQNYAYAGPIDSARPTHAADQVRLSHGITASLFPLPPLYIVHLFGKFGPPIYLLVTTFPVIFRFDVYGWFCGFFRCPFFPLPPYLAVNSAFRLALQRHSLCFDTFLIPLPNPRKNCLARYLFPLSFAPSYNI